MRLRNQIQVVEGSVQAFVTHVTSTVFVIAPNGSITFFKIHRPDALGFLQSQPAITVIDDLASAIPNIVANYREALRGQTTFEIVEQEKAVFDVWYIPLLSRDHIGGGIVLSP